MHRGRYRPPPDTLKNKARPLASSLKFDDERADPCGWLDEQLPWQCSRLGGERGALAAGPRAAGCAPAWGRHLRFDGSPAAGAAAQGPSCPPGRGRAGGGHRAACDVGARGVQAAARARARAARARQVTAEGDCRPFAPDGTASARVSCPQP